MVKSYLELGQIVSTHGIKGEVRFNPWCDTPEFVKKFKTLYFDKNGEKSVKVISARPMAMWQYCYLTALTMLIKPARLKIPFSI